MKLNRKSKALGSFNAAPMNDIIFFLLLFFLLTSSFVQQAAIKLQFPKAVPLLEKPKGDMSVTISADGRYFWNTEELLPGGTVEEKEAAVKAKVDEYFARPDRSADVITLNLDKSVPIGAATPIMGFVANHEGAVALRTEK
jgi:biopolymer transport protein ExbD